MGRKQFLHSSMWRSKKKDQDAVIGVIKDIDTNETKIEIFKNPKRKIGITKEGLREGQNMKKIYEPERNLDTYVIHNHELKDKLKEILHGNYSRGYFSMGKLINSLFVYGVDINIDVLIKQHYNNENPQMASKYRVGALDIETDMVGDAKFASKTKIGERIIIINYTTPENKTFSGVLKEFVKGISEEEIFDKTNKALKDLHRNVNSDTRDIIDAEPPTVQYKFFDNELDLIKWTFKNIHENKPEYCSIWNMDFDIESHIIPRIRALGGNPYEIMCHPEIPKYYRVCNYRKDNNPNLAHFTHAWSYFELSGYTQFYDSMCLYSRIRKHKGVEPSYALDFISKKVLGDGKKSFDELGHVEMQTQHRADYCAYGVIDTVLCVLLEKRLGDIGSMHSLIPLSDIASFAQQTHQLKNSFFDYCKKRNLMPGSQMGKLLHETDEQIINVGGNVLSPGLAWRTGVTKIKELIDISRKVVSKMCMIVGDLDVTLGLK